MWLYFCETSKNFNILGGLIMEFDFYWEQFEKTGNISDYLNYTACTSEDEFIYTPKDQKDNSNVHGEKERDYSNFS
jgi:hypothetical protein